ncbi:sigma factor [Thermophilibacter mediterraneus]|uniref:sigma factor n=1 Tax=Thermophilibacter mediterraneus TaxID=1871031 RepID=UPI000931E3B7|nr:sigma factor [Thermophilibacter mediterraneus]
MRREKELLARVRAAKGSARAADDLVRDYLPFIKSETAKFMGRPPREGADDELGIAMFAFHEAVLAYDRGRGAFLPLAALSIRNRLVDFRRRERRHEGVDSLDEPRGGAGDDGRALVDDLACERDEIGESEGRSASRREIVAFARQLEGLGIGLADVAQNCPKQGRTLEACGRALAYARGDQALLDRVAQTGKLPLAELARGSGVERKTLERHRRYLVALLVAYTNGYEIIRGHLCRMPGRSGGEAR